MDEGFWHGFAGVVVRIEVGEVLIFRKDEDVKAEFFRDFPHVVFEGFHFGLGSGFFFCQKGFGFEVVGGEEGVGCDDAGCGDDGGGEGEGEIEFTEFDFFQDELEWGHGVFCGCLFFVPVFFQVERTCNDEDEANDGCGNENDV